MNNTENIKKNSGSTKIKKIEEDYALLAKPDSATTSESSSPTDEESSSDPQK